MTRPELTKAAERKLSAARSAIKVGMRIVALQPKSKVPDTRFCVKGANSAVDDVSVVRDWLAEDPSINLGAVAKQSPVLVIDVDGPEGEKALGGYGQLPETRETKTRNGRHLYFRHDGQIPGSWISFEPKLDIIASGYVLLPESSHPDGGRYRSDDAAAPIAELPAKIANAIMAKGKPLKQDAKGGGNVIAKGQRDNRLASLAGSIRRQGFEADLIATALHAVNNELCKPPLSAAEVEKIARSISRYEPEHEGLFELLSNVTPRKVRFLWEPYLVRGAVNLWEGDPDVGKTFVLCAISAALSSGTLLPGQGKARPQNVLFMSAEDDAETTLVPRMMRMGADLSRVWALTKFVRLDEDVIQLIEQHIEENKVRVIILDPLLAFMQGGIDMNKANETRPFMARLAELAKKRDVTIIALRHLNKSTKDKAIFRGLGSIDITAAARSAIMIGFHPEDSDVRVLTHSKHNLSERGVSLLYTLEGHDRSKGIVPKLVWRGESELTAEDLASKPNNPGRPDDASKEAELFLQRMLADGPKRIKDIVQAAERRSIAYRTLRTVRQKMGIIKQGQKWKLAETSL